MTRMSPTMDGFAKTGGARMCTTSTANETINSIIANKIRDIYNSKTAETLAAWLKISVRTAKHRLASSREFTLDEVEKLLHSEHGFEILAALMTRAKRPPSWWRLCVPLMDLADAERMVAVVRKRTDAAIRDREEVVDALTTEIRRAQAAAIHSPEQAGVRLDALRSYAGADRRMVATKGRGMK